MLLKICEILAYCTMTFGKDCTTIEMIICFRNLALAPNMKLTSKER